MHLETIPYATLMSTVTDLIKDDANKIVPMDLDSLNTMKKESEEDNPDEENDEGGEKGHGKNNEKSKDEEEQYWPVYNPDGSLFYLSNYGKAKGKSDAKGKAKGGFL